MNFSEPTYTLRPATLEDAYEIWTIMDSVSRSMEQKEHFICDDLEYVQDILTDHGFGVVACDFEGKIVGNLLVKYPGVDEENLGYDVFLKFENNLEDNNSLLSDTNMEHDISLNPASNSGQDISPNPEKTLRYGISLNPEKTLRYGISPNPEKTLRYGISLNLENLESVVHMDSASVLPEHRGHHLESRMIAFAETLIDTIKYTYAFATVAPENLGSLKSLERNGYQVMVTKEKYGGVMRCVMMKRLI